LQAKVLHLEQQLLQHQMVQPTIKTTPDDFNQKLIEEIEHLESKY
jgi:hypothetical protein